MAEIITLDLLKNDEKAKVIKIETDNDIKRRLWDLGLTQNAVISKVGTSPFGDPIAFMIKNTVIALRKYNCKQITVEKQVAN